MPSLRPGERNAGAAVAARGAVALGGLRVHAAIAGAALDSLCATRLCGDWLADVVCPLDTLEIVDDTLVRDHRDEVGELWCGA